MAKLAIIGHPSKGSKVIEILRSLGGINALNCAGIDKDSFYYIGGSGIICHRGIPHNFMVFTIDEFLEKFPYKVGDKVTLDKWPCTITGMSWEYDDIIYYVQGIDFSKGVYSKDLQPYKETMEDKGDKAKAPNLIGEDYSGKRFGYKIPNGYEFDCIKNNEIILKPKQPQYPKTYYECSRIIGFDSNTLKWDNFFNINRDTHPHIKHFDNLIESFCKLLICRDAFWKIAGEQMELGRPWVPENIEGVDNIYYTIHLFNNKIYLAGTSHRNAILSFPTAEMRDTFYENFKDLIEQCKELL